MMVKFQFEELLKVDRMHDVYIFLIDWLIDLGYSSIANQVHGKSAQSLFKAPILGHLLKCSSAKD